MSCVTQRQSVPDDERILDGRVTFHNEESAAVKKRLRKQELSVAGSSETYGNVINFLELVEE
jgi:hypothetical protein